jgi:hypothetical protein
MTTRDLTAGRTREANAITAVLAVPCGLACAGTIIPSLDDVATFALLALGAFALAAFGLRYLARWARERAEDLADAHTAALWRARHAPHLLNATDHRPVRLASLATFPAEGWS